jgi:ubiquinone/menaquinone biosynthesis C-methylase UbiE
MSITGEQERLFYDRQYSAFLELPDADLAWSRATLLADLDNPSRPIYERRRLFRLLLDNILIRPVTGLRAMEYGCGTGDWGILLATEGARVTLLDLSPVAIQVGLRRAQASGVAEQVTGVSRDASDLSCFKDGEFDLIVACAAVHHTLKYPNALSELARVLKPGGRLLLAETYGNNPLLNAARRLQWKFSSLEEEAGEDIIFSARQIEEFRKSFASVQASSVNLFAMAKRIFRGRFHKRPVRWLLSSLEALDTGLLAVCPPLKRYCGEAVIEIVR